MAPGALRGTSPRECRVAICHATIITSIAKQAPMMIRVLDCFTQNPLFRDFRHITRRC
jgi:hypothetical protein